MRLAGSATVITLWLLVIAALLLSDSLGQAANGDESTAATTRSSPLEEKHATTTAKTGTSQTCLASIDDEDSDAACSAASVDEEEPIAENFVADTQETRAEYDPAVVVDDNAAASADDGDDLESQCSDGHERCAFWASLEPSECIQNPGYMLTHCQKSCGKCKERDQASLGTDRQKKDEDDLFRYDLGVIQSYVDSDQFGVTKEQIEEQVKNARDYMARIREDGSLDLDVIDMCKLEHELCAMWSLIGECDENPSYMKINCAPACQACHYLTIDGRCPIDPNAPHAWEVGDLDKMFRRLSSEPYLSKYDVKVLSSPDNGDEHPWVLTMENVITESEAERLIELGAVEGYVGECDWNKHMVPS